MGTRGTRSKKVWWKWWWTNQDEFDLLTHIAKDGSSGDAENATNVYLGWAVGAPVRTLSAEELKDRESIWNHKYTIPKIYIWVRSRSWQKEVELDSHVIGDSKSCDGCHWGMVVHKVEKKNTIPLLLLPSKSTPRRSRITRSYELEQHHFGLLVVLDWVQWWLLGSQCGEWKYV